MPSRSRSPERVSFANIDEALPLPDLISIQRDSFQWFLDKGLAEAFGDISPIEDFTGQLSLELEFDPTDPDTAPPAEVHGGGVQGEGHDVRRAGVRPGAVLERHHR